jgi:hypothetical protein
VAKERRLTNGGDDNARSIPLLPTCALFKEYTGERVWESIGDKLRGPCYLSGDDHDRKIGARKQRTDIGKYSSVNRTIKL